MKGIGCDDSVLVSVLGFRSPSQLKDIIESYRVLFGGKKLADDVSCLLVLATSTSTTTTTSTSTPIIIIFYYG